MGLERAECLAGDGGRDGQHRLRSQLLIESLAAVASGVGLGRGHKINLLVGGDNEDRRLIDFPEYVGQFVGFPVVPPDDPNAATGGRLGRVPRPLGRADRGVGLGHFVFILKSPPVVVSERSKQTVCR